MRKRCFLIGFVLAGLELNHCDAQGGQSLGPGCPARACIWDSNRPQSSFFSVPTLLSSFWTLCILGKPLWAPSLGTNQLLSWPLRVLPHLPLSLIATSHLGVCWTLNTLPLPSLFQGPHDIHLLCSDHLFVPPSPWDIGECEDRSWDTFICVNCLFGSCGQWLASGWNPGALTSAPHIL